MLLGWATQGQLADTQASAFNPLCRGRSGADSTCCRQGVESDPGFWVKLKGSGKLGMSYTVHFKYVYGTV